MTKGYGTAGEDYEQESAVRDCRGDESVWGWLRGGAGRRKLVLAMACTCAAAVGALAVHGEAAGIKRLELAVKLPAGEQKIVRKAQDASLQFASSDVTEASIKAQQAAKKQYEAMIASALKAEAQAHKLGEKASEMSLKAADDAEHRKLVKQQQRAMRCVYPLVLSPKGRGLEGLQERRPQHSCSRVCLLKRCPIQRSSASWTNSFTLAWAKRCPHTHPHHSHGKQVVPRQLLPVARALCAAPQSCPSHALPAKKTIADSTLLLLLLLL